MSLKHAIASLASKPNQVHNGLLDGIIIKVYPETDTCDFEPFDGTGDVYGVKLTSLENDGSGGADIVKYPLTPCFGVIGYLGEAGNAVLLNCTKVASIKVKIASVTINIDTAGNITMTAPSLSINGGTNNGLVNIMPLIAKLNNLENKVNSLLGAFKLHSHPANNTITTTVTPANLVLTAQVDLEDTNIKH